MILSTNQEPFGLYFVKKLFENYERPGRYPGLVIGFHIISYPCMSIQLSNSCDGIFRWKRTMKENAFVRLLIIQYNKTSLKILFRTMTSKFKKLKNKHYDMISCLFTLSAVCLLSHYTFSHVAISAINDEFEVLGTYVNNKYVKRFNSCKIKFERSKMHFLEVTVWLHVGQTYAITIC